MSQRKIDIQTFRRRLSKSTHRKPIDAWDSWLPRLSHGGQFFLSMVTAASLFFTVIPLYQKAVLEESLAKKEVELKAAEKVLDGYYSKTRGYFVSDFVFANGVRCTGLMIPPIRPGESHEVQRDTFRELLDLDPKRCLLQALDTSNYASQLRPEDAQVFAGEVRKVADELDTQRTLTTRSSSQVLAEVESGAVPEEILDAGAIRLLRKLERGPSIQEQRSIKLRQQMLLGAAKRSLATKYGLALREKIRSLDAIAWPRQSKSQ